MLSLQRLKAFRAVCELGSVTKAARAVNYTQSAVSQHIALLEDEMGVPLLIRQPRGVAPTGAGKLLWEHSVGILDAVEKAEREVSAYAGIETGTLHLGAFSTAAATLIPAAMEAFRNRYPGVDVEVIERDPDEAMAGLLEGELDLAIVFEYDVAKLPRNGPVAYTFLMEDPHYIALPSHHRLARRDSISVSELADETWIDGSAYACQAYLREASSRGGFEPRIGFKTDNYATIQGMIAADMGVAFMPELAAFSVVPGVSVVKIRDGGGPRRILAATHRDATMPPATEMTKMLERVARDRKPRRIVPNR